MHLKKIFLLTVLVFVKVSMYGQWIVTDGEQILFRGPNLDFSFQFSNINSNDDLTPRPRFSWNCIYYPNPLALKGDKIFLLAGLGIQNTGILYDTDTIRIKNRIIAVTGQLGLVFLLGYDKSREYSFSVSGGCDYNLHYKEVHYADFNRKNKKTIISEYNSHEVVNQISPYMRLSIGPANRINIFALFYFDKMFVNSQSLQVSRYTIGLTRILMKIDG